MQSNTLFDRYFLGFDKVAEKMASIADQTAKLATNYPPYNVKKLDENKYVVEMAVAGFGKQDIDIEMVDGKLIIKGSVASDEQCDSILYQGLAMRPFTRQFTLADNVEIEGAEMLNGILKIVLEHIIPEHKKPKKIDITEPKEESAKAEFLQEEEEK